MVTAGCNVGKPIAELRPIARKCLSAEALVERWKKIPVMDAAALRADVDRLLDTSL